jgi:hypothetical protein
MIAFWHRKVVNRSETAALAAFPDPTIGTPTFEWL